ncbi:MAG: nucleotide pyrophosphatase/phosphodiesterase family protein [Vicinamibacterales bacterium]
MHFRRLALGLALVAPIAPSAGCQEDTKQRVLLISLDGFRWDYRDRFETPTLDALASEGTSAEKLQPVFPTKTFPNHFTLVTGLVPDHHGVVSNTMKEGSDIFTMSNRAAVVNPNWWQAEPIWTTLEKRGRRTAPLLWPGSEAPIGGVMPAHWIQYKQDLTDAERIQLVADLYSKPEAAWPDFATMYWHEIDTVGHAVGPDGNAMPATVERVDGALGRLRERLESLGADKSLNIIVVSDHGMSQLSPDRVIYLEDYIDLGAVETIDSSPNIGFYPKALTVDQIYERLAGRHPHLQVYRKADIPERLNFGTHPRVPPIYAMADDGWSIIARRPRPGQAPRRFGGTHGYDNDLDSMQGLFVAAGPALKAGVKIDRFRAVDLYELMCRILDVTPRKNDGNPKAALALLR